MPMTSLYLGEIAVRLFGGPSVLGLQHQIAPTSIEAAAFSRHDLSGLHSPEDAIHVRPLSAFTISTVKRTRPMRGNTFSIGKRCMTFNLLAMPSSANTRA